MTTDMIGGKFMTTMPEVMGYEIEESMGVIVYSSMWSHKNALKGLARKAEDEGCNAVVNVRVDSGYGYVAAFGEGVIVKEKPFSY